ncbi:MAG TPA: DUF2279 domain-containing protein [Usitatibacter sp.]|nr:DUF2279 domain-containing protein [Usitatibacter sp.]
MTDLPSYDELMAQARVAAAEVRPAPVEARGPAAPPNLRLRNTAIIAGGAAIIAGYGYHAWWRDGFTRDFRTQREGWFGRDTAFSGIDKLGHAYTGYFAVRAMAPLFEAVGNTPAQSRRLAAWTTWGTMSVMEVLDGFSRHYAFSREDFIANTVGVVAGYALASSPAWDDAIDFRLAYRRSPLSNFDPPGDYAGQRYHLAVKADGFAALRDVPILKYLELNVAYGAPGVDTPDEWRLHDFAQRRREVFLGVSVNLSRVLADAFYGGARSTTRTQRAAELGFELLQPPVTLQRGRDLDR